MRSSITRTIVDGNLVVTLAVSFLLGCVASAEAAPFTPEQEATYQVALDYWGGEPAGCLSVDRETVEPGALDGPDAPGESVMGRATQTVPGQAPVPCILRVVWIDGMPAQFCDSLFHEVGHLRGLGHTDDPTSVMSHQRPGVTAAPCVAIERHQEAVERLARVRQRCRDTGRPKCWREARRLRRN